jgi:hypothetical protein
MALKCLQVMAAGGIQILTVRSNEAEAINFELCEKTTDLTSSLRPLSVCRQWPLAASQNLIVPSVEAEASSLELCEKTAEYSSFRNQFDL